MMLHIERQLQIEDVEDDDDIDDVDWEDMEIENDMENLADMYSLLALKKQQNSSYSTVTVYQKWKFNFFNMIWVEMRLLMHLLLSLVIMIFNRNTECSECHSISLFHLFKTTKSSILHRRQIEKDENNLHQHTN